MLKVDGSLDHIPARRAHVVSLHESINRPLVNLPGYGAAPTGAFVLRTRNDRGAFLVFVYLYQPETQAVLIYVSEPRGLSQEQAEREEGEAVRFVESMGFMVDDVQFGRLSVSEQEAVMERTPVFRPLRVAEVLPGRPASAPGAPLGAEPSSPGAGAPAAPRRAGPSSPGAGAPAAPRGAEPSSPGAGAPAAPRGAEPSSPGAGAPAAPRGAGPSSAAAPRGADSAASRFGAVGGGFVTGPPATEKGSEHGRGVRSSLPPAPSRSGEPAAEPPRDGRDPGPASGGLLAASSPLEGDDHASPGRPPETPSSARSPPSPKPDLDLGLDLEAGEGRPSSAPPANGASPERRGFGRGLPALGGQGAPALGAARASAPPRTSDDSRAREARGRPRDATLSRLGRLLGTFCLLLACARALPGCATTSRDEIRARQAQLDLGHRELARGQWAEGLRRFREVLGEDEDNGQAHRGAGLAYWRLGRLDEAERHLRRAVSSDESWSEPKNDLAAVLVEQGACEEAQALLRAVLDDVFYPTHHFAEHNLARAEACAGEHRDAIERLDRLTEERPKFCLAYLTASEIAERADMDEVTIEACEGFREECVRDDSIGERIPARLRATCDLRRGRAYAALGDVESARTALERCSVAKSTGRACREALGGLPP